MVVWMARNCGRCQDEIAENRQDVAFKQQITVNIHSLETTLVQLDEQREIEWDEAFPI